MKAASSEWYNTTARHVLPVPTSSLSSTSASRTSQGQRLLHGSTSSSYASRYLRSSYDPSTSLSSQRSLSIRSTGSGINNSSGIPSTKRKPYSFSKSRSSQSTSSTTGATFSSSTDPTTSTTSTSGLRQTSVSRSDDLSSYKYKRSTALYPLGISSSSYLTSSFPRISETEAETDLPFTEGEEEDFTGRGTSLPTDEASTTEEEEDEDDVYKSFTDSLRMLRVPQHRKTRSISPALSFQSVLTELEEDEEDLPPDQVEDEMQTTTEEEEEEGGESSGNTASYFSSSVPKSPVKVRVKVEKASSSDDHDDGRVKVTVQLEPEETEVSEEEEESDSEEEEEDDDSEATENTAETVRYRHRRSTHESRTDEDESDDYGNEESESGGESESDLLSEVPEPERTHPGGMGRAHLGKTDSKILIPSTMLGSPYRHIASLGDMPSRVPSGSHHHRFPAGRSRTIHEIQSKTFSESKKSDSSKFKNTTSAGGDPPPPPAANNASSHSETSSRSQSARTSAVGRGNPTHRMYSLGGKLRSLSARKTVIGSSSFLRQLRPPPSPIPSQSLSVTSYNNAKTFSLKDSTSSSSTSDPSRTLPDTSSSTHYILSKFASLAPPPKPSPGLSLPKLRSLSASRAASKLELEQLRQLSLGNNVTTLPPITPSSPSQSSSTSSSLSKPRPFVRKDTYTVLNPYDPEHLPGPYSPPEYVNPCVAEHLAMHQIMSQDLSEEASSVPAKSGPVPLPYDSVMTAALSFRRDQSNRNLSFATYVLENSMVMSSYQSQTTTRQSTSSQLSGSGSASTNGDDEHEEDNEEEVRAEMERVLQEDRLINKNVITLGDLEQEVVDDMEPPQVKHDKLKKFALATIRKQMVLERKRLETIFKLSDGESDEDDDEEDDEDGSSEEDSDEDNPESSSKKQADGTHIPMPVGPDTLDRDPSSRSGPPGTQSKSSGGAKLPGQNSDDSLHITQPVEAEWNWKDDLQKNFDNEDLSIRTPVPSRPESAESGYRALPPSRASTVAPSRQVSTDSMEQEKDRLLSEWKKAGGVGAPPSIPKSTKSGSRRGSGSGVTGTAQDGSESLHLPELIHGNIDLNKELPDEKKLNLVWEEFTKDDREAGATADYDFSSLIDEMVTDVNNYKLRLSSTSGINLDGSPSQSLQVSSKKSAKHYEVPKFDESRKYQTLSEMVSLLSHNLRLISAETMEDHMASLISLISNILKKVRKNKTEEDYVTQIACLSAIRVLCDRLLEMHNSQNLKYADLSWLFRILCKYSSDSDSKIRPEASFCLARLVKVAGPALVVRPIYFILVMESEGGSGKTTTGAKTKAAAIDTLTYALLTFPKEDFHNLEEIAGWVCLAMLNEERRIRQSALECLAIISKHITREKALPLFHTLFLKEELDHFSRSPSPESNKTGKTGKSHKGGKGSEPIPLSVHGTVRLLTGPGFPIAQPIDAITARLDKDILPVPSTKGLIEYAVNVPTGKDLVLLMTHMLDKDDDEWDFSSSTDSMDSGSASVQSKRSSVSSLGFSDIDWTGQGQKNEKKGDPDELITADVAYILLGKGRVNKQEVVLLDTYKKEIIPEIIEMLRNSMGKQRKNRKRYGKQKGRRRRRKGQRSNNNAENPRILDKERRPPIPTLSFDCDDDDNDRGEGGYYRGSGGSGESNEDEAYDDPNSPVAVVVDPPFDEETPSQEDTETATQSTSK